MIVKERKMKILIVEDDLNQIKIIEDAIEEFEEESISTILRIDTDVCNDLGAALTKIDQTDNQYDGAIIDISLEPGDPQLAEGNKVISRIKQKRRFPIRVVSSDTSKLSEEHEDDTSIFFKAYNRNEITTQEIISQFYDIYKTGITQLLNGSDGLEKKIQNVVWNHLAQDLSSWYNSKSTSETSLMRYILTHLVEYLDLSDEQGHYNDAEYYIIPPIRKVLASGDIVKNSETDELFIILSPACDITVRSEEMTHPKINAQNITLVKLHKINNKTLKELLKMNDNITSNSIKKKFEPIMKGQDPRLHYLPEYRDVKATFADFRNIYTVDFISNFLEKYERIGTVSSHFFKDIQSKFSNYHARQGSPDLDTSSAIEKHILHLIPTKKNPRGQNT